MIELREIPVSKSGISYLPKILRDKTTVVTKAVFLSVPRSSGEEIHLKVGRYKKPSLKVVSNKDVVEVEVPRSELTLVPEELESLLAFIQENYQPFKQGIKSFIPISLRLDAHCAGYLKELFESPNRQELLELIVSNEIIPNDLLSALETAKRKKAIEQFEIMLSQNLTEHSWQEWFQENNWVLGSDCVQVISERRIDKNHISDFLVKAFDGFLDIVEIKRPEGNLRFWHQSKDHDNYCPSIDLIKAITQSIGYIHEVELEANSVKFQESVGNIKTIKPRCTLIFGRSNDWNNEQQKAFRLLNSSYHNLTILTYDHVLIRAKRMVGLL